MHFWYYVQKYVFFTKKKDKLKEKGFTTSIQNIICFKQPKKGRSIQPKLKKKKRDQSQNLVSKNKGIKEALHGPTK